MTEFKVVDEDGDSVVATPNSPGYLQISMPGAVEVDLDTASAMAFGAYIIGWAHGQEDQEWEYEAVTK